MIHLSSIVKWLFIGLSLSFATFGKPLFYEEVNKLGNVKFLFYLTFKYDVNKKFVFLSKKCYNSLTIIFPIVF